MFQITSSKGYRKNIKKLRASGSFKEEKLREVLQMLVAGTQLPAWTNDHALSGDLISLRECHIKGNLLLLYKIDKQTRKVVLSGIGAHHQIFGS